MDERVKLAARNNALWCDSVCRAHGLVTELTERLWICHDDPPRYHSNAVTLSPGTGDAIEVLKPNGFKDGFYEIDARSLGYTCLFEASWIWLESTARGDSLHAWKRVETDDELLQWE
jgi:hypothetical protein